ncbi:hypothetical protein CFP56_001595 [Quercus suber]|uniref:Uncharacterized protein n=1 Tax=Quercus suber TaxID=58331 RepID=A0AAW0ILY5_QUESU
MKASLKFREDQKPLLRAKVPLSILGLPFQSGVIAGESKELTLNLGTFFESGPSIKIAYRPNDTWNPFSLVVKTGTGPFGSPISSSMLMSAEFNLIGRGNPGFMLHFKPQFGDFSIKKSQSSVFDGKLVKSLNGTVPEDDSSIEIGIEHVDGGDSKKKTSPDENFPASGDVAEACFTVKRQLEILHAENGRPWRISGENSNRSEIKLRERNGNKSSGGKFDRRNNDKKSNEGDVNEELKKALMGATGS